MSKFRKITALLLAVLFTLVMFASCKKAEHSILDSGEAGKDFEKMGEGVAKGYSGPSGKEIEGPKKFEDITLAYVVADLTNEVFAMQLNEMIRYTRELGINFVYTSTKTDAERITAIENYINMGVDAILSEVGTPEAMEDIFQQGLDAGIPMFAFDNKTENADAFWSLQNYEYGQVLTKVACDWMNETFSSNETINVAICHFGGTSELAINRETGCRDTLAELVPNAKVVAEFRAGNPVQGVEAGENFMNSGHEIHCVIGLNDGGALGVYEIFKANGYLGDKIGIFGADATSEAIVALKENSIFRGTVTARIVYHATDVIDILLRLAQGDMTARGDYFSEMIPVTYDDIGWYEENNPVPENLIAAGA